MKFVILTYILFNAIGCEKKDTTIDGNQTQLNDAGGGQDKLIETKDEKSEGDSSATGALALGNVNFSVLPVSASAAFLTANEDRNAEFGSAGSLNLPSTSAGLRLSGGSAWTVPTPVLTNAQSGLADELKVFITRIELHHAEGDGGEILFSDPAGAEVYIKESGKVDISGLLASALAQKETAAQANGSDGDVSSGNSPALRLNSEAGDTESISVGVKPGTYGSVEVHFLQRAYVKGCVSAQWGETPLLSGADTGVIKYCTRTGKDPYALKAGANAFSLSDFKYVENGTEAETEVSLSKFNLSKSGDLDQPEESASFPLRFETLDPIVIEEDKSVDLTLMIDLNRMLKFYRAGDAENGVEKTPNPAFPKFGSPYFYTTVFEDSVRVFVGKPGKIMGFELVAKSCAESGFDKDNMTCTQVSTTVSQNYCTSNNYTWDAAAWTCTMPRSFAVVSGWMTLIFDPENRPLYGIVQPDEDNALTVIKGNSWHIPRLDGAPNFIRASDDPQHGIEILYGLKEEERNRLTGFQPEFFGAQIGERITDIFFNAGHVDGKQAGPVAVFRRL